VKPILIYDGDCQFCRLSLDFGIRNLSRFPKFVAYQKIDPSEYRLSMADVSSQVWLVEPATKGLKPLGGHLAVAHILLGQPEFYWRWLGFLMKTPPFSFVADFIYRWVAKNRHRLPGGARACKLEDTFDGTKGR
jgi:predicted DCC family thiol-disulfide oxidoreductase YuxK